MNRNTLARSFQSVEEVNRLLVFQDMNLAALVAADSVIRCGDPVPAQRDNQNFRLRVQEPLYLLERQLVCLGDLAGSAVSANLKV